MKVAKWVTNQIYSKTKMHNFLTFLLSIISKIKLSQ